MLHSIYLFILEKGFSGSPSADHIPPQHRMIECRRNRKKKHTNVAQSILVKITHQCDDIRIKRNAYKCNRNPLEYISNVMYPKTARERDRTKNTKNYLRKINIVKTE